MAGITRTNGLGHVHGTQYNTNNTQAYEIDCLVDISAEGGVGKIVEAVAQAINPTMYVSTGTAGKIFAVVDDSQHTAASLQVIVRNLGTINSIDVSNATVTARDLDEFDAS